MSCTCSPGSTCCCCAGTSIQTPQLITNTQGQPVIAYRTGTWATFKESMLARLSSAAYPALASLKTRDDDDFTIAFLDASAVMLDILSFYQERLANESYLRTAQQLQSLTSLSQLIGYQPAPGISASVYLAFTLKTAPGISSDPTAPPITIPAATQTQSIPGQGQTPQTFETSAPIPAKADWNALSVLAALPWTPSSAKGMYLAGTATQLNAGDLILMLGARATDSSSNDWTAMFLTSVTADTANSRTWITWSSPLPSAASLTSTSPLLYAFRQRAALFGYNAIDPNLLDQSQTGYGSEYFSGGDWPDMNLSNTIDFDSDLVLQDRHQWLGGAHADHHHHQLAHHIPFLRLIQLFDRGTAPPREPAHIPSAFQRNCRYRCRHHSHQQPRPLPGQQRHRGLAHAISALRRRSPASLLTPQPTSLPMRRAKPLPLRRPICSRPLCSRSIIRSTERCSTYRRCGPT